MTRLFKESQGRGYNLWSTFSAVQASFSRLLGKLSLKGSKRAGSTDRDIEDIDNITKS